MEKEIRHSKYEFSRIQDFEEALASLPLGHSHTIVEIGNIEGNDNYLVDVLWVFKNGEEVDHAEGFKGNQINLDNDGLHLFEGISNK